MGLFGIMPTYFAKISMKNCEKVAFFIPPLLKKIILQMQNFRNFQRQHDFNLSCSKNFKIRDFSSVLRKQTQKGKMKNTKAQKSKRCENVK